MVDSAATAWSTTQLLAQEDGMIEEVKWNRLCLTVCTFSVRRGDIHGFSGGMIQLDCCCVFKQELNEEGGQDSVEEGFGSWIVVDMNTESGVISDDGVYGIR